MEEREILGPCNLIVDCEGFDPILIKLEKMLFPKLQARVKILTIIPILAENE